MLISCSECGKAVSDQASHCPHCGFPIAKTKRTKEIREMASHVSQATRNSSAIVFPRLKTFFIISIKLVIFFAVVLVLAFVFNFIHIFTGAMERTNDGWIYVRSIGNLILPLFWLGIFYSLGLLFGSRAQHITYRIFICIAIISVILEIPILLNAVRYEYITWAGFSSALFLKIVGLCIVGDMQHNRIYK